MFKKIGILALLMLCFTLNMEAQKNSKDAQRKAKLKEKERMEKEAKKGSKSGDTKDINSDDSGEKWTERLIFGGGLGVSFFNGWNINVTPSVGYKITDRLHAGVGLDYYYGSFKYNSQAKQSFSVVGPKVFGVYYVIPELSIQTELIHYTITQSQVINGIKSKFKTDQDSWLVGAGYTSRFGNRGGVRLELFYDVLYDETNSFNLRNSAFFPRISVVYGL
jgi:hypothetical protein